MHASCQHDFYVATRHQRALECRCSLQPRRPSSTVRVILGEFPRSSDQCYFCLPVLPVAHHCRSARNSPSSTALPSMIPKGQLQAIEWPTLSACRCPELLKLCSLLAKRRGQPPLVFPSLRIDGLDSPVLPYMTAFEVIAKPITALGIGKRMRKGVIL